MEHFSIVSLDTPQEEFTMFSFTWLNGIENHHTFVNQLYYIISGSLSVLWRGESFTLQEDDVFFIPSDEFCIQHGHLCWVWILCLPSAFLTCDNWKIRCCSGLWGDKEGSNYEPLKNRLAYYIREQAKISTTTVFIRKLLLALGTELSESYSYQEDSENEKKRKIFHELLEYINQNHTRRLTLKEVATRFYYTTSYLSRLFFRETGLHFSEYLRDIRVEQAIMNMIHQKAPLSEIAVQSGFSDLRSFQHAFQEKYHQSPKSYRQGMKQEPDLHDEQQLLKLQTLIDQGELELLLSHCPQGKEPSFPSSSPALLLSKQHAEQLIERMQQQINILQTDLEQLRALLSTST